MQTKKASGVFHSTKNGLGYVTVSDQEGDMTIPVVTSFSDGVFDGDRVTVLVPASDNQFGRIFSVESHAADTVTGVFTVVDGKPYVIPDSYIPCRVPVKRESRQKLPFKEGDKVFAEILKYKAVSAMRVRPIMSFGDAETLSANAQALFYNKNLTSPFSQEAEEQARRILHTNTEHYINKRLDLRSKVLFTISNGSLGNASCAFSVTKDGSNTILGIHIADVAEFITPDSPLGCEARKRGRVANAFNKELHIMPSELVNNMFSFDGNRSVLTISIFVKFDPDGGILGCHFEESIAKSIVPVTFSDIDALLKSTDTSMTLSLRERLGDVVDQLYSVYALAAVLYAKRLKNGGVDYDYTAQKLSYDSDDRPTDIQIVTDPDAFLMLKEILIGIGQAVAEKMYAESKPNVYAGLSEGIFKVFVDKSPVEMIIDSKYDLNKPGYIKKIVEEAHALGRERLFFTCINNALASPSYSAAPLHHFIYNLNCFSRISSPSRRFADLVEQRCIKAYIRGESFDPSDEIQNINSRTESILRSERLCREYAIIEYMRSSSGRTFSGSIAAVTQDGVLVILENGVVAWLDPQQTFDLAPAYGDRYSFAVSEASFVKEKITVHAVL